MAPIAEAVAPARSEFLYLSLDELRPSPLNPRKHFDDARLKELAESITAVGIIEPLVARRVLTLAPNGECYEIIAGARRHRAATLAGLDTVPVIVKDLTDTQVLEVMVIENNQREDVNPLEEADGFERLLHTGYDIDKLAERIGRSRKYIYDRVKLLELVPTAKKLLLDSRLTAGHAILIARLKSQDQERAISPDGGAAFTTEGGGSNAEQDAADEAAASGEDPYAGMKPRSVRELQSWIANHVRFDVAHAAQAVPLEFGQLAQRVDAANAKPGRGKKVISITFDSYLQPDVRDGEERTYRPGTFTFADGEPHPVDGWSGKTAVFPKCAHAVLGVVAAGTEHYGRAFDVCVARDKCEVHWKAEIAERQKNQKLRDSGQASKAATNERRQQDRYDEQRKKEEAERQAWNEQRPRVLAAFADHVKGVKVTADLVIEMFPDWRLKELEKFIGKVTEKNLGQAIALGLVLEGGTWSRAAFVDAVKPFKFNVGAVEQKPAEAKPASAAAPAKKKAVQTSAPKKSAKAKPAKKSKRR